MDRRAVRNGTTQVRSNESRIAAIGNQTSSPVHDESRQFDSRGSSPMNGLAGKIRVVGDVERENSLWYRCENGPATEGWEGAIAFGDRNLGGAGQ